MPQNTRSHGSSEPAAPSASRDAPKRGLSVRERIRREERDNESVRVVEGLAIFLMVLLLLTTIFVRAGFFR